MLNSLGRGGRVWLAIAIVVAGLAPGCQPPASIAPARPAAVVTSPAGPAPSPAPPSSSPLPVATVLPLPAASPTAARPVTMPPPPQPTPTRLPTRVRTSPSGSVPPSPRYSPLVMFVDGVLEDKIRAFLGDDAGYYGIVVKRFSDGRGATVNPNHAFYAASLFKLEVLFEVYKQRSLGILSFEEKLKVTPKFAEYDLQTLPWKIDEMVAVKDLVEAMITISDNTSAMMLYNRVGGHNIDLDMQAIGLQDSNILTEAITTSAYDMALLLEMMARGQAVDQRSSEEMMGLLSRQKINNRLPALLPRGTQVAHKTGEWENATHDVGVVYAPKGAYVIAILSSKQWNVTPLAQLSAMVYQYFQSL